MARYATGYPPADPLTGDEELQVVQGGTDRRATARDIARLAHVVVTQAEYDALTPDPDQVYLVIG